ncbi:MAG: glucose-6-phosphate isomerase [Deltaproteobacteria bacterium]|nr:glucose-6-phosphate isomerase [Deltaproteobacteria bacterium]
MDARFMWDRFQRHLAVHPSIGLALDVSRMKFGPRYFDEMHEPAKRAFESMDALEKGAFANPDEKRQVGHYWLRNPAMAPTSEARAEIEQCLAKVQRFAADVHQGRIRPPKAERFKHLLIIGIGGSALGPQFVSSALQSPSDPMDVFFFDNTDPDGMDRVLARIGKDRFAETLVLVISKSGGTKETRNGMLEAKHAFELAGVPFAPQTVAVTQQGSALDKLAVAEKWLERFPMWDWIGGRTSETSVVGLLPAALQGFDIEAMLKGARDCDEVTRSHDLRTNPSMLLALMWMHAVPRDMVVLPYKDRLELLTRYLQQLVMESLGKGRDLAGNVVRQGIAVYGNKGSTDQHAYVQQLREGVNNFFVTFIDVLHDRQGASIEVEPAVTSGDYLLGFFLGTRNALFDNDRESVTIVIDDVNARAIGVLIALYERAVGFYASLAGINAYHQPGVEAGKKAAGLVIALQLRVIELLTTNKGKPYKVEQIASALNAPDDVETIFHIVEHFAANPERGLLKQPGAGPFDASYLMR